MDTATWATTDTPTLTTDTTARGPLSPSPPLLLSPALTPRRTRGCCMVTAMATPTTDTATLTTDTPTLDTTTASGRPTPSPSPQLLPTLTLTPRRTPTCFTVDTTATWATTDTPTLTATSTARGPPSQSPLPTPRPIPRLTPTCFTVDTTDIPTLTGATTAILTSTANRSALLPLHCPEEHRNTKTTSPTSWTLHLTVLYKLLYPMDERRVSNLSNMCDPTCSFV